MSLTVEIQSRDGKWFKIGSQNENRAGVYPESIMISSDLSEYGCLEASFTLRMNPRWPSYLIEPFAPVVISDGVAPVWSGRIIALPTTFADNSDVVVSCQGWGQHLKDDCTPREWVINDLSRWVDSRSMTGADLSSAGDSQNWNVTTGGQNIVLGAQNGTVMAVNTRCGVTIDLGADVKAQRVMMTYKVMVTINTICNVYMIGHDTPHWLNDANRETPYRTTGLTTGAVITDAYTYTNPHRYVTICLYAANGFTAGSDFGISVSSAILFSDLNDESGNASILKSSTIIQEVLADICPMISKDYSRISATSLSIPNFPGSQGFRYANELIDQANSYHGYIARLTPDPVPIFEYAALPTDYSYALGNGEYTFLEPASQDGRAIYDTVISEFDDVASNSRMAITANTPTSNRWVLANNQLLNPSFTTNTAGWDVPPLNSSVLTRDTGVFQATPASLKVTAASGTRAAVSVSGESGDGIKLRHKIGFWARTVSGSSQITVSSNGSPVDPGGTNNKTFNITTTFQYFEMEYTRNTNFSLLFWFTSAVDFYLDEVNIYKAQNNLVQMRGFRRTALRPMEVKSNLAAATQISQLELDSSQYPPFKGTIGVSGRIRTKGGGSIPVSQLPSRVGDAILIENMYDINTGALGRQGIIRTATYTEDTGICEITIDDPKSFLDVLKARLKLNTPA